MKFKTKDFFKNNKIKLIIASVLFAVLILSFFFASSIETILKLDTSLNLHQVLSTTLDSSSFKVTYINVGQGNSTYIKFPDGKVALIDGGNIEYGEKVAKVLKDDGVTKIDYMIASHADADHIAGLNFILKEFEVKNIFRPFQIAGTGTNLENFVVFEDEDLGEVFKYLTSNENGNTKISRVTTAVYKNFITNIYNEYYIENGLYYHSNVEVFYDGLKIEGDGYAMEFFAPLIREGNFDLSLYSNTGGYATIGYGINNSNDNSAVVLVKIFDYKFLFTGDSSWTSNLYEEDVSESHGETDFVNSLTDIERENFTNTSVFMLGHHGSSFSSGEDILKLINAEFFIISAGENNSYEHPNKDTLARISEYKKFNDYLLATITGGNITFGEYDGKLAYALENFDNDIEITISWQLLGSILYIFVVIIIFSLKCKKPNNQKNWLFFDFWYIRNEGYYGKIWY